MSNFTPRPLPAYAVGTTMYQIFLRQFTPEGTLKAAEKMLPYLAELGIRIAYLCPIFDADADTDQKNWSPRQIASGMNNPKNPYRMNDYFKIDPEYGTDNDLKSFVRTAHRHGLRIMLDLVYLHCGPKANLLNMKPEYIQRDADGSPILGDWKFPLLNFDSPELREYLWENMLYFVREFDIDGYRCDVGGAIPISFWEEGRRRIDAVKKEFLMLSETVGKKEDEVFAFELVYSWYTIPILKIMSGEITPKQFWDDCYAHHDSELRAMCFTDSHDVSSDAYENRVEKKYPVELNDLSLAVIFALPGMPLLYNGQEIADTNRHSIWANHEFGKNLGINWSKALTPDGRHRFAFVQELIRLRGENPVLAEGSCVFHSTDANDKVLAFERILDTRRVLCLFNFSKTPVAVSIPSIESDIAGMRVLKENGVRVLSGENGVEYAILPYSFALIEM